AIPSPAPAWARRSSARTTRGSRDGRAPAAPCIEPSADLARRGCAVYRTDMVTCPACGHENPDSSRFCGQCGTELVPAAAPAREERKVVTILFTDLVGSTAQAEGLDPEDVRATLSSYYAQLRTELERHGGTVEKFIGDAVMAAFGAPVAH